MSDRPNIIISGSNFKDFVAGDQTVKGDNIGTQNNYYGQPEKPEILAEELDALLEKEIQGEIIPEEEEQQKAIAPIIEHIQQNPTLKDRLVAAGKAGIFTAIEQCMKHPLGKTLTAAIKAAIAP